MVRVGNGSVHEQSEWGITMAGAQKRAAAMKDLESVFNRYWAGFLSGGTRNHREPLTGIVPTYKLRTNPPQLDVFFLDKETGRILFQFSLNRPVATREEAAACQALIAIVSDLDSRMGRVIGEIAELFIPK